MCFANLVPWPEDCVPGSYVIILCYGFYMKFEHKFSMM